MDKEKDNIPSSPAKKVSFRTMESDLDYLKTSGGQPPKPFITEINGKMEQKEEEKIKETEEGEDLFETLAASEVKEPVFKPGEKLLAKEKIEPKIQEKSKKGLSVVLVAFGILIVSFVVFYFFFPVIFPFRRASVPPETPETSIEAPVDIPVVDMPTVDVSADDIPADILALEIILTEISLIELSSSLKKEALNLKENDIRRVVFRDANQNLVKSSQIISLYIGEGPEFFEREFVAFLFLDENKNEWFGYVFKFRPDIVFLQAQALLERAIRDKAKIHHLFYRDYFLLTNNPEYLEKIKEEIR